MGGEQRAVAALAEDTLDDIALDRHRAPAGPPGVGAELDAVLAPGDLLGLHGERVGEGKAVAEDELREQPVAGRLGQDDPEERAAVLRRQGQVMHAGGVRRAVARSCYDATRTRVRNAGR